MKKAYIAPLAEQVKLNLSEPVADNSFEVTGSTQNEILFGDSKRGNQNVFDDIDDEDWIDEEY